MPETTAGAYFGAACALQSAARAHFGAACAFKTAARARFGAACALKNHSSQLLKSHSPKNHLKTQHVGSKLLEITIPSLEIIQNEIDVGRECSGVRFGPTYARRSDTQNQHLKSPFKVSVRSRIR